MPAINSFLPLKPAAFHMLVALEEGEKHGYAIRKSVERETNGQVQIRIGSLYNQLRNLLESGLIGESNKIDFEEGETRRRTYHITLLGQKVLIAEVNRLREIIDALDVKGFGNIQARETGNAV